MFCSSPSNELRDDCRVIDKISPPPESHLPSALHSSLHRVNADSDVYDNDIVAVSLNAVDFAESVWVQSSNVQEADDSSVLSHDTYKISNVATDIPTELRCDADALRVQLDKGAMVTATNFVHLLHDYHAYDEAFPCRLKLTGAIDNPLGEGYLHVPVIN